MPTPPHFMKESSSVSVLAVQVSSAQSMQIAVSLLPDEQTLRVINTHAKVDSGADVSCID